MLMWQVILVKTERVNDLEWILMGIHWFVLWLGTILVPSHYTNQLIHIIFLHPQAWMSSYTQICKMGQEYYKALGSGLLVNIKCLCAALPNGRYAMAAKEN